MVNQRHTWTSTSISAWSALVGQLDQQGFTAASKCLADDLDELVVHAYQGSDYAIPKEVTAA